ncbi:hypothetical protein Btru_064399 [Bulinus truncatus]|nr:hypothetical protein Btru_064399 [Bulinus truncatus]
MLNELSPGRFFGLAALIAGIVFKVNGWKDVSSIFELSDADNLSIKDAGQALSLGAIIFGAFIFVLAIMGLIGGCCKVKCLLVFGCVDKVVNVVTGNKWIFIGVGIAIFVIEFMVIFCPSVCAVALARTTWCNLRQATIATYHSPPLLLPSTPPLSFPNHTPQPLHIPVIFPLVKRGPGSPNLTVITSIPKCQCTPAHQKMLYLLGIVSQHAGEVRG